MKLEQEGALPPKAKFWEIFFIRDNGEWMGFRMPLKNLRRFSNYLVLLLFLLALCFSGWLLTRWKNQRLQRQLQFEMLHSKSLQKDVDQFKAKLAQLEKATGAAAVGQAGESEAQSEQDSTSAPAVAVLGQQQGDYSFLPSLEADTIYSSQIEVHELSARFNGRNKKLSLVFTLQRQVPREGTKDFYWVALVHGPQGVLAFPSTLSSRRGELLIHHRGMKVSELRNQKKVEEDFPMGSFVERAGSEPTYVSLFVYDEKGSLLMRQRQSLDMSP